MSGHPNVWLPKPVQRLHEGGGLRFIGPFKSFQKLRLPNSCSSSREGRAERVALRTLRDFRREPHPPPRPKLSGPVGSPLHIASGACSVPAPPLGLGGLPHPLPQLPLLVLPEEAASGVARQRPGVAGRGTRTRWRLTRKLSLS